MLIIILQGTEQLDYLEPKVKGSSRARVHPEVELRTFFEELLAKMKEIPKVISLIVMLFSIRIRLILVIIQLFIIFIP